MRLSAKEFAAADNKRLTLLGMSGVGKTHLAKLLSGDDWYHYSGDYRIGTEYLNAAILANTKNRICRDGILKKLLDDEAISVQNHITFSNLSSVSSFLGKVGNPEQGGLPIDKFTQRQALHREAEINAMLDVDKFISKAKKQGFAHFINDAGGSLCELDDDKIYQNLAQNTLILYIRSSKKNTSALIERAQNHPKPLYYQQDFLQAQLAIFLQENQLTYVAQIDPDEFASWVFIRLLEYRIPKYEALAKQYGYTIDSESLYQCTSKAEALELIGEALN
ncbi:MAG: ATPase [Candidatus Thioglobus sp.]|nr:MAG: ATPase [Candidatus Thioglobus sp.]